METMGWGKNIYAAGRNYVAHAQELNNAVPDQPVIFAKSTSCISPSSALQFPKSLGAIHHELEIVMRLGRDVPLNAYTGLDVVDAVALGLDMTARDRQRALAKAGLPWFLAKNFQHAAFVAPFQCDVDPARRFQFYLERNGSTVQQGDTDLMLFPADALLRFLNQTVAFQKGDLLFTGTPAGVGPVAEGDNLRLICDQLDTDCEVTVSFVS